MTDRELEKHKRLCSIRYGYDGEDVFSEAYLIAFKRYGIDKVNQNLFGLICKEAARKLRRHEKYEIPFSVFMQTKQEYFDLEYMEYSYI